MPSMLDAERLSNDFEVVKPSELKALKERILELEEWEAEVGRRLEVLQERANYAEQALLNFKRAAANGAWCRRSHTSDGF